MGPQRPHVQLTSENVVSALTEKMPQGLGTDTVRILVFEGVSWSNFLLDVSSAVLDMISL